MCICTCLLLKCGIPSQVVKRIKSAELKKSLMRLCFGALYAHSFIIIFFNEIAYSIWTAAVCWGDHYIWGRVWHNTVTHNYTIRSRVTKLAIYRKTGRRSADATSPSMHAVCRCCLRMHLCDTFTECTIPRSNMGDSRIEQHGSWMFSFVALFILFCACPLQIASLSLYCLSDVEAQSSVFSFPY